MNFDIWQRYRYSKERKRVLLFPGEHRKRVPPLFPGTAIEKEYGKENAGG